MERTIKRSRVIAARCLLVVASAVPMGIILVYALQASSSRFVTYFLVIILGLVVLIPIFYRSIKGEFNLAEPGMWFALFYFSHFGIRAIYDTIFGSNILGLPPSNSNFTSINAALFLSIIGLTFFWVGYYISPGKNISKTIPSLPRDWNESRIIPVALGCLLIGWGIRIYFIYQAGGISEWMHSNKYVLIEGAQGSVYLQTLAELAIVGALLLFVAYKSKKKEKQVYRYLFLFFLVFELFYSLFTGSRFGPVSVLLGVVIAWYMLTEASKRMHIRLGLLTVCLLIILIVFFPFLSVFRSGDISSSEALKSTKKAMGTPADIFEVLGARNHGLDSLTIIMSKIREGEPFTNGSELLSLLVAWVPRQLWQAKPTISLGRIIYEKYFPSVYSEGTSVAVTLPGEFYLDFGYIGAIIGMFIVGIAWSFLNEYFVQPHHNLSNVLFVGVFFSMFFVSVEQTLVSLLSYHLAAIIITLFVIYLLGEKGTGEKCENTVCV